ncbi:hypothetical protein RHMOL_Rhmol11G0004500 [Rhododendron molle]|uniref:Uncharacterized protein n=1 Tax=Rhododendron molle TaxID=49168 RepID=A0ACC0LNV2_RHOML|nr:hypothetical protein RHMOL_Rhmol11G0004500 [Rhododendron molle]
MIGKGTGFAVELFNVNNNFIIWQQRVKKISMKEGLVKALKKMSEKQEELSNSKWRIARFNYFSGTRHCWRLSMRLDPTKLWNKLESRYKSKLT